MKVFDESGYSDLYAFDDFKFHKLLQYLATSKNNT